MVHTKSLETDPAVVDRRTLLKGAIGIGLLAALSGCRFPGQNSSRSGETVPTPEAILDRDFQTYIHQVTLGITGKLNELGDKAHEQAPREYRDPSRPAEYRWERGLTNFPEDNPFELDITAQYTEGLTYREDGYSVDFTICGPTQPDGTGRFVTVELRPDSEGVMMLHTMLAAGDPMIEIALKMVSLRNCRMRSSILYMPDPDSVGGKKMQDMSTDDFDLAATLEQKRQVYDNYRREVDVMRGMAQF